MAGVRSSKTVGSTTYKYDTLSGKVMRQTWLGKAIEFIYDENNQPYAMRYNGTVYYYVLNVQGDVVGLLNASGAIAVEYTYDPWGKLLNINTHGSTPTMDVQYSTAAEANPLRYRGYYYDTETGFYYLQTRYYDPAICRFINADTYTTTDAEGLLSTNMFAYCENNPVNMSDETGTVPSWLKKVAVGVVAIAVGAVVVAATGGAATAVVGAAIAGLKTAAISGAVAAGTSAIATAAASVSSGNDIRTTLKKSASAAAGGFAEGFMWGGIASGASRALGYLTSKTGIFKRNVTYGKNNFMFGDKELTIWKHGRNFRLDASATRGLHYHLRTAKTGIGQHRTKGIPEIIGGTAGLYSATNR